MLLRLLHLVAILLFPAAGLAQSPQLDGATASLWDHNGSVMRMFRWPDGRLMIAYDNPREGIAELTPRGTVMLTGKTTGDAVVGKAGVFKRGCPPAGYVVEGSFSKSDADVLVVRGAVPVRRGCRVVGYRSDGGSVELTFTRLPSPSSPALASGSAPVDGTAVARQTEPGREITENTSRSSPRPSTQENAIASHLPALSGTGVRNGAREPSGNRVALIFGIGNYASLQKLENPVRDATAIAQLLRQHGFKVHEHLNPTHDAFRSILSSFKSASSGAREVIVFYAGHGMTVLQDNRLVNALAATDANLNCETRQGERMIAMREILDAIAHIPNQAVLFDSCRDDPLAGCKSTPLTAALKGFQPPEIGERRISHGASSPSRSAGQSVVGSANQATVLVGYATSLGKTALDGDEQGHSPFTRALLDELAAKPKLPLREVLDHASRKVAAATQNFQIPWVVTEGGEPAICLAGSCATRATLSASVLSGDASLLIERGSAHIEKQDFESSLVLGVEAFSAATAADDQVRQAAAHDIVQSAMRSRLNYQILHTKAGHNLGVSLGKSGRLALSFGAEDVPVHIEPGGLPYYVYTEPPEPADVLRPDFDQWKDGKRINPRVTRLKGNGRGRGASSLKTVRVWDVETKEQVFFRRDYDDEIIAAHLRDHEGEVVVVHDSGRVIVQQLNNLKPRIDMRVSSNRAAHVALSPDADYIAIGVPDDYKQGLVAQFAKRGYMAVLDLQSGEIIARVPLTGGTLEALALGPKGKVISFEFGSIFFSSEESAPTKTPGSVWSVEKNARLFSLPLQTRGSQSTIHVISDDGRWFVHASHKDRVDFYSIDQRKAIGSIEQPGGATSVTIHPSKALAATVSTGGDIRVWGIGRGEPPRWLHVNGYTRQIAFDRDGESIFVAAGSLVQKLDIKTGAVLSSAAVAGELKHVGGEPMHPTAHMAVARDRDILLASFGRQIRLYKNTIAETGVLVGHRYHNPTSYVGFSRDGTRLIESTMDALRIYDARTLSLFSAPRTGERSSNKVGNTSLGLFPEWIYGPGSENGLVAFKVSSANFVESFSDRVAVGSVKSLAPHQSIDWKGYSVWGATISPEGRQLAASLVPFGPVPRSCNDHMITVRNLGSGEAVDFCGARIGHHASPAISPNSDHLAFVTQQGKLSILDVRSRAQRSVEGLFNPIGQPVFSRSSKSLFVPRGRSILEVSVSNGAVLRTLPGMAKSGIKSISISRDGEWLASADLKGVRIWSLASGLILQSIEGPWELNMSNGAFDANADRIVFGSSSWNRVVRVYKDPDVTMVRARKTMPGCLSKESRDRMGLQSESPEWCAALGSSYRLPELN